MKSAALLLLGLLGGCGRDLPIVVHIDNTFSAEDRTMIEESVAGWNVVALEHLRNEKQAFIIGDDIGSFTGPADLRGKINSIFRVDDYKNFTPPSMEPGHVFGYTSIYTALLYPELMHETAEQWTKNGGQSLDDENKHLLEKYFFRKTALHELGHLLELIHYANQPGIMKSGYPSIIDLTVPPHLQAADIGAFCKIYDCK